MKVDRDTALTRQLAGHTYHFCSDHCLHAFQAGPDPARQAQARRQVRHAH
jgi:YHS domain-containing protein